MCLPLKVKASQYCDAGSTGMLKKAFAKSITVNHFALPGTEDKIIAGLGTTAQANTALFTARRS